MCEIEGCTQRAVFEDVEDFNYLCIHHYNQAVKGEL